MNLRPRRAADAEPAPELEDLRAVICAMGLAVNHALSGVRRVLVTDEDADLLMVKRRRTIQADG
jgi:hypothetical protein